jgi:hypothetical protein
MQKVAGKFPLEKFFICVFLLTKVLVRALPGTGAARAVASVDAVQRLRRMV